MKKAKKSNKAEGIKKRLENEAVQVVLDAIREPNLEGDLDELAKKFL